MKEYVYNGQVYSLNKLSEVTTISLYILRKMVAPFSETTGRIEVTELIDDYLKKRDNPREYVYNGQVYPSLNKLSLATTISSVTLKKMFAPFSETEGRIEVTELIDDYLKKRDNPREYVYKGQVYTITQLSEATNISFECISNMLKPFSETEGRIVVDQMIDEHLEKRDRTYSYNGDVFHSIREAAKAVGINNATLRKRLSEMDNDLEKVMEYYENKIKYSYKGQVYPSIMQLSEATTISYESLRQLLEPFSKTKGIIEVDPIIDENLGKWHRTYQYDGVIYDTIKDAAKAIGISVETLRPYLIKTNYDLEKAMELYDQKRVVTIIDGVKYTSKQEIAKSLGVKYAILNKYVKQEGSIEAACDAIKNQMAATKNREGSTYEKIVIDPLEKSSRTVEVDDVIEERLAKKYTYSYLGKTYASIGDLANEVGIERKRLGRAIRQCDGNAEKAIMMIKTKDSRKDKVLTKDGSELSLADMATIWGLKREELKACFDRGMSIDQIKKYASDKKANRSIRGAGSSRLMYDEKTTLVAYCIKNKLNYRCIHYAITEYGKTIPQAINNYLMNGQKIPASWIHERYDILLKHLLLDAQMDYQKVISAMRQNLMPLREALEYVVVRDDAREKDLDPEWQHEIYSLYTDTSLSEEERQECVKAFYITPKEIEVIEKSKEKVDQLERQLDLYEIAESIRDRLFTEEETIELLKLYKVSDQEGEKAIRDFCNKFQNGVLRTPGQQEGLKYNKSIMNYATEILNRYAKLMKHGQADGKEEVASSKIDEGDLHN